MITATSVIIVFIIAAVAFVVGYMLNEHVNQEVQQVSIQEYADLMSKYVSIRELNNELRALAAEQGELIDTQAAALVEYSDLGPEEHLRIAENMLNVERNIIPAEAFNQMLKPSRRTASRIMRMHMEPEDNANATDFS